MSIGDIFSIVLIVVLLLPLLLRPFGALKKKAEAYRAAKRRAEAGLGVVGPSMLRSTVQRLAAIPGKNLVAVVNISGTILTDSNSAPFFMRNNAVFGEQVRDIMLNLASVERVRGVLTRFQTPGGTVSGSEAIREGMEACNKEKPVIAHVTGMSASGGVWAMSAARRIYAERESIIGSIGVIGPTLFTYKDVTAVQGMFGSGVEGTITARVLSKGRGKSFGSPYAEPEAGVVEHFEQFLEDTYNRFKALVLSARPKMVYQELEDLGAMVTSSQHALDMNLIDGIGNMSVAEHELMKEANLSFEDTTFVQIVVEQQGGFVSRIFAEYLPALLPHAARASQEAVASALSQEIVLAMSPLAMRPLR